MNRIVSTTAVLHQSRSPFRFRDVALASPGAGEVIVEIDMCTICGSDLHTIEGRRPLPGPMVLGHEIIGRVAQLPDNEAVDVDGSPLSLGDRVTWSLHACCNNCFWCCNQLTQKCDQLFKYGHEPVSAAYPSTGGFASHCQLRSGTAIVRLPDSLADRVACPANCATATVAAAFRQVRDCHDKTILILGAGMLGLSASAMAQEKGASAVVVVDPNPCRAKLAESFGATVTATDLVTARTEVEMATHGRGADIALDFSGQTDAVLAAIHFLRIGGQAVLVGSVFPSESVSLSPEMIVRRWLRITGVHNYLAQDLVTAIEFLRRVELKYPFESLVSTVFDLSDIDQAVRYAASGDAIRVAVTRSSS